MRPGFGQRPIRFDQATPVAQLVGGRVPRRIGGPQLGQKEPPFPRIEPAQVFERQSFGPLDMHAVQLRARVAEAERRRRER